MASDKHGPLDDNGRPRNETDWPYGHRQRLRDRYRSGGISVLTHSEILQLILCTVRKRGDTHPQADALLQQFGSLAGVLEASQEDLLKIDGIGPETALLLSLIRPTYLEAERTRLGPKPRLNTPEALRQYAMTLAAGAHNEQVWLVLLDASDHLIRHVQLQQGSHSSVAFYPEHIVKQALTNDAAGVALVHNHTCDLVYPSADDELATQRVLDALRTVNIRLVDHLIVYRNQSFSFRMEGLLNAYEAELASRASMPLYRRPTSTTGAVPPIGPLPPVHMPILRQNADHEDAQANKPSD